MPSSRSDQSTARRGAERLHVAAYGGTRGRHLVAVLVAVVATACGDGGEVEQTTAPTTSVPAASTTEVATTPVPTSGVPETTAVPRGVQACADVVDARVTGSAGEYRFDVTVRSGGAPPEGT